MCGRPRRRRAAVRVLARALVLTLGSQPAAVGLAAALEEPPAPCLLAPVAAPVRDPFRPPGCRWCPGNRGLEYLTTPGTPVRAGAGGVVTFAGTVAGTRYVVIEHSSGLRTTYGALAGSTVAAGEVVAAGVVVGSASARLHFGVRRGEVYLDPTRYLARRRYQARLVPLQGPRRPATASGWTCAAKQGAAPGPGR